MKQPTDMEQCAVDTIRMAAIDVVHKTKSGHPDWVSGAIRLSAAMRIEFGGHIEKPAE
jgi:transketolase